MRSENMLESVETNRSYIPSFCETVAEQSLYLAEGAELIFNEMFEQIGISELAVYESTGIVMVYEGAKLESLKRTLLGALDKIWGAIKHSFEQMLAKLKERVMKNKFSLVTREAVEALPSDAKFPDVHEFPGLEEKSRMEFINNSAEVRKSIENFEQAIRGGAEFDPVEAFESGGSVFQRVSGIKDAKSAADVKKALKEQIVGKTITVDVNFLKSNRALLLATVKGDTTMNQIKSAYNKEKENIDKIKTLVKGLKDDFSQYFQAYSTVVKDLIIALDTCHSIQIDASFMRMREYGTVLAAAAALISKSGKGKAKDGKAKETVEKVKGEVVNANESVQEDIVAALFYW